MGMYQFTPISTMRACHIFKALGDAVRAEVDSSVFLHEGTLEEKLYN